MGSKSTLLLALSIVLVVVALLALIGVFGDPQGTDAALAPQVSAEASVQETDASGQHLSPGCPVSSDPGPGDHEMTVVHDGMKRPYAVHVPPGYDPMVPTPVVVNVHGFPSSPRQHAAFSDLDTVADEEGFIVVYPQGFGGSWNGGECCGAASSADLDDVGYIEAVVADIGSELCVDAERVYATGIDSGAYLVNRLACEAPGVFAAVAPVAGGMPVTGCDPDRPVAVVGFHGTLDHHVGYEAGEETFKSWASLDGCMGEPERTSHGDSFCDTYTSCEGGVEVSFCTVDPMAHCWPGGDRDMCEDFFGPYSDDIDAGRHMWDFMSRFVLD